MAKLQFYFPLVTKHQPIKKKDQKYHISRVSDPHTYCQIYANHGLQEKSGSKNLFFLNFEGCPKSKFTGFWTRTKINAKILKNVQLGA